MVRDYLDANYLAELYNSGVEVKELAERFNVGKTTIRRRLDSVGVIMRGRKKKIDISLMVSLYNAGSSVNALSKRFDVDRRTIYKRLVEVGITPRGPSESMYIHMGQLSAKERSRRTAAAHSAIRGKRQTFEHLCKRAIGVEASGEGSRIEKRCISWLSDAGFSCTPQKAVGPYNVDIALDGFPVAVEIFGGNWHAYGEHAARFEKRVEYILNAGWHLVIIWVIRDYPLEPGAIDYIVSLAELISSGKAERCEEHMIRGDGELTSFGYRQLHGLPVIPGPQPRDDSTGRFVSRTG